VPRLSRTTEVLERAGATQGVIYGRLTDLEVYAAILTGDSELFAGLDRWVRRRHGLRAD